MKKSCATPSCTKPRDHVGACSDGVDHSAKARLMGPCEVCGSKADTVVAFPVSLGDHFLGVMRVCRNASFAPAHDRELCRAALVKRWIREGVTL